jgi:hypothetical protein
MSTFELENLMEESEPQADLRNLINKVPAAVSIGPRLHPEISDQIAERSGFISRESSKSLLAERRQPRGLTVEETRQLSIRMPVSLYNDFLAFANQHKMTYNEAIRSLLDRS